MLVRAMPSIEICIQSLNHRGLLVLGLLIYLFEQDSRIFCYYNMLYRNNLKQTIMILSIYLLGFLLTYFGIKLFVREKSDNTWNDIVMTFVISIFSWCSFIMLLIYLITEFNPKFRIPKIKFKPPKWL